MRDTAPTGRTAPARSRAARLLRVAAMLAVAGALLVAPATASALPLTSTHTPVAVDYKGWAYVRSGGDDTVHAWKWTEAGWQYAPLATGHPVWAYPWGGGWTWIWVSGAWHATQTTALATWSCAAPGTEQVEPAAPDATVAVFRFNSSTSAPVVGATAADTIALGCSNGYADAAASPVTYVLVKVTHAGATSTGYADVRSLKVRQPAPVVEPEPEPEPVAGPMKPPIRGIVTRTDIPSTATTDRIPSIDNAVVSIAWSQLETSDQRFDGAGWAMIDRALSDPRNFRLRLRIRGGVDAPLWVRKLGHAPVSAPDYDCSTGGIAIYNAHDGKWGCSAFFWTDPYLDEYEELMREVARRYEGNTRVNEVVDAACMTIYAEPFYRAHGDLDSNKRLYGAGLDFDADLACHERAMSVHSTVFRRTRTSLAINTWDIIDGSDDDGRRPAGESWEPARDFVLKWKEIMGERLVLQNNGLGADEGCPLGNTWHTHHYCFLAWVLPSKGFQTETWERLGGTPEGLYRAIDMALDMNACFVELPSGYTAASPDTLTTYDTRLSGNC